MSLGVYRDTIERNIKNFPEVLIENDYQIDWVYGGMYTLIPKMGHVLSYGTDIVLYQELDVERVHEDGVREELGKTVYATIVEDVELLNNINEYEKNDDGGKGLYYLTDELYYVMDQRIRDFGTGRLVKGCKFITNAENVVMTKQEFISTFIRDFRRNMEGFFTDILVQEEFNRGVYRVNIESINIVNGKVSGWGVILGVTIQHLKTLSKRTLQLEYKSSIKTSLDVPDREELKNLIGKEVEIFTGKNKESQHLGVIFRFMEVDKGTYSPYVKIMVEDKELFKRWEDRITSVLESNREKLQEYMVGIKREEGFGYYIRIHDGRELVFSAGGIMVKGSLDGVYLRKEMNLQEGLRNLSEILGRSEFVLELMKTYDYRTNVGG